MLDGYQADLIDGFILSPMALRAEDLTDQQLAIPAVLLGERISDSGLVHIAVDNVAAAQVAVSHLIERGRRRIAAVGADYRTESVSPSERRMRGYRRAVDAAGLEPREVATGGWARSSGYAAVRALLADGAEVDALFCFNDVLALGAIRAITDHGLRVPDDIAVVG